MAVVVWRKKANRSRLNALLYGRKEFGLGAANRMNQRFEHCADLLAEHAYLGKVEPLLVGRRFEYRSIVVHEHYKMIYHVDKVRDIIYIVDLWDIRREPQQLTKETT
ncbi:MAG: type II toxin-antitoxin system RelE/ParE family toxin [Bacteroidaceae bacterium]|nr:type II toxin-antitoxin system RelE/ParE family toxin [Bacteroidaceae bacterium]